MLQELGIRIYSIIKLHSLILLFLARITAVNTCINIIYNILLQVFLGPFQYERKTC